MILLDTHIISELMRPEPNRAVIAILDDSKRKQALSKAACWVTKLQTKL